MSKIAVIASPRLEPHRPPPGPAIIAHVCQKLGHDVTVYDLNIKFFQRCRSQSQDYGSYDAVWEHYADPTPEQDAFLQDFIDHWCKVVADENYDYILISVFGHACAFFTNRFLKQLRPQTKATIVAGGNAVNTVSLVDHDRCYGRELQLQGLIDHFITGEGEHALELFFNGQGGPGINNTDPAQIDDINNLPGPDYSYYNLDDYDYLYPGEREVYITGSRGCVRKCTYCDVERYWPKFRYRSGSSIAREIIENYERFGITRFYFTDSLVNGSLKAFSEQCEHLAKYRFDQPIKWSGQFIFRPKRSTPRDHYRMISEAGGNFFYVGLETGSDRLRFDMAKKFTNDDIDFNLEQCSQNNIRIMPLMFTGYVTETLEDHYDNLKIFQRWQRYVADGTINAVELGSSLVILPGAPVERMVESHDIRFVHDTTGEANLKLWYSMSNPELTLRERIRRKLEIHETAIRHHWPVWRQESRLNDLKQLILKHNLHLDNPVFSKIIPISR